MKSEPLALPDYDRCQAVRPSLNSFMSLGGSTAPYRFDSEPVYSATEVNTGEDGQKGSMSSCEECANVMVEQLGASYATLTRIDSFIVTNLSSQTFNIRVTIGTINGPYSPVILLGKIDLDPHYPATYREHGVTEICDIPYSLESYTSPVHKPLPEQLPCLSIGALGIH